MSETQDSQSIIADTKGLDPMYTKDFGFLPIPTWLRYNPEEPFQFGLLQNFAFAFASMFTVANLYYCQALLLQLSTDFGVTHERVSRIPAMAQAGYATALILITPMGDLVRRRPLALLVVSIATALTVGIVLSDNVVTFEVLSFFIGIFTVTPQLLIPLAADLAPPSRRASAISIVMSGLIFGILVARVFAGIIAEFSRWRAVYYFAIGVQSTIIIGLYLMLPDYPAKNKGASYFQILFSMAKFAVTEPLLVQACLISVGSSACYSNFWVTLTFLLGGPIYNFSTLGIGLFGLLGLASVATGPFIGRGIDKLMPWYGALIGIVGQMIFQAVHVGAGGVHIAAVVVAGLGLDVFRQTLQVSLTSAILSISVEARARLSALMTISLFIGHVMGTSVGSKVFLEHGWRAGASLSLALFMYQLLVLFLRGPHLSFKTWFGFTGGFFPALSARHQSQQPEEEKSGKDSQC